MFLQWLASASAAAAGMSSSKSRSNTTSDDDPAAAAASNNSLNQDHDDHDDHDEERMARARAEMCARERACASDAPFRAAMTPLQRRAAAVVAAIREREALWDPARGRHQGQPLARDTLRIARDSSRLWPIVRRMPKGALLHAHGEAFVDVMWILAQAFTTPGICFHASEPLSSAAALRRASLHFVYSPLHRDTATSPTTKTTTTDLYTASYVPGTLVPANVAAEAFIDHSDSSPTDVPARTLFVRWLHDRAVWTTADLDRHADGVHAAWQKFQNCFTVIGGLYFYVPIFRRCIRRALTALLADNVQYLELRIAMCEPFQHETTGDPIDLADACVIFRQEVDDFKAANPRFWGARLIYCSLRFFPNTLVRRHLEDCLAVAAIHPDTICGFDLVGFEDAGLALRQHLPELLWFRAECRRRNLDIPFIFHAGETLSSGGHADDNLYDAILLGTRRIGHGFSLHKHPHLMDLARDNSICVEICPISNEALRLTPSILNHPLPALIAHGVPCCINNDDPSIFLAHSRPHHEGTDHLNVPDDVIADTTDEGVLSHDFWQVLNAFDSMGLPGVAALARASIAHSIVREGKGEIERRLGVWDREFEEFCGWVVDAHPDVVSSLDPCFS